MRVAVVGGGIIGAACARWLADADAKVTVFDEGHGRAQATWASAGLLLAGAGHAHPAAWSALATRSMELWPALGERFPRIELRRTGVLLLDDDPDWCAWRARHGYANEPASWGGCAATLLPEVMTIRPTRVVGALLEGIDIERQAVRDLRALSARFDAVVVAAGAWSQPLLRQAGCELAVAPRAGQMMVFDRGDLPHVLYSSRSEEVAAPRADGRVVVGTTLEDIGFAGRPDPDALHRLERWARTTIPGLGRREAAWVGMRPWSDADLPTVAQLGDRTFAAVGHFRNGLLLAPATAEIIRDLVLAGSARSHLTHDA